MSKKTQRWNYIFFIITTLGLSCVATSCKKQDTLDFRIGNDFGGWLELRKKTIASLRDIADYIDSVTHKSAIVKAFGSGSGIVAGSLTLAGGILVFISFFIFPCLKES